MKKSYKNIIVTLLGGDERMRCLAQLLASQGFEVKDIDSAEAPFDFNCNYLILPLPLTQDGIHLNCQWNNKPKLVDIISKIPCGTKVLAGCVSERVEDVFQQRGIEWTDYYGAESLQKQNAYLTAEATLQLVMQNTSRAVKNSKVLVIGSGRCGKQTAKLFKKIGAKVTLTSRKLKDKIKTLLMGIKPAKTARLRQIVNEFQVIVNTVPHPVLTECVLQSIPEGVFVVELASSAAGVDLKAAEKHGTNLLYAPSLPGRYLHLSAAEAISNTLTKIIREDSL